MVRAGEEYTEGFCLQNHSVFMFTETRIVFSLGMRVHLTCGMICCFGKRKYLLRFDRSKDHSKRKSFLRFVFVLPKQQIILQVRSAQMRGSLSKECV